jgi:hypothetical protein
MRGHHDRASLGLLNQQIADGFLELRFQRLLGLVNEDQSEVGVSQGAENWEQCPEPRALEMAGDVIEVNALCCSQSKSRKTKSGQQHLEFRS